MTRFTYPLNGWIGPKGEVLMAAFYLTVKSAHFATLVIASFSAATATIVLLALGALLVAVTLHFSLIKPVEVVLDDELVRIRYALQKPRQYRRDEVAFSTQRRLVCAEIRGRTWFNFFYIDGWLANEA